MQALVTGGGGFLGGHIVEQLVAQGARVRVFCRGRHELLEQLGLEVLQGDLRDAAAVARACAGVDAVFHVAALPGIWGPWKKYHETNTLGTEHVIRGCLEHGVTRLIYTSSPSVVYNGQPHEQADESLPYPQKYLCHYPRTKALAEQAVLAANEPGRLLTVALRPHLIWGPRDNHLLPRLIRRARTGRLRIVGTGENFVSMSYVENVAAAHLQACAALTSTEPPAGRAYFINERQPVCLWDWVNDLLVAAGLPPVKRRISEAAARRLGAALEFLFREFKLPGEPPMTRFLASQLSQTHTYATSRAEREFGFTPVVSVDEGLRRVTPELRRLAAP
jgi:nucleoside-diphosphate-sugar epimerase